MPERRRKLSPQFNAEAVQLVIETGKPIAEVPVERAHMKEPDEEINARARTDGSGRLPGRGRVCSGCAKQEVRLDPNNPRDRR
jgi:transposase-like protein